MTETIEQMIRVIVREELAKAKDEAVPDEFLTPARAAVAADVSAATIRRWVRQGKLTGHRTGRTLRIKRAELEAVLRGTRARNDDLTPEKWAERLYG